MSFDLSRISFNPRNNFSGLLMQQGRVQLDADWNEWVAQIARRIQAGTLDSLGPAAVPWETPDAFRIGLAVGDLSIGTGRLYVDGLLAENHGTAPWQWDPGLAESSGAGIPSLYAQPYLPYHVTGQAGPAGAFNRPPLTGGPYLVYLDVWQREVTYLQQPELVEKAVGVDTTGRLQTVWQVRLLGNANGGNACVPADGGVGDWAAVIRPSGGRLTTSTGTVAGDDNPCIIPPQAGYKGLENQLYRVEIHKGGPLGTATFKWSRDNGTVATRVTEIQGSSRLVVESLGRDDILGFHAGDWIEVLDDWHELHGLPGPLRRIGPGGVDPATRSITLADPLPAGLFPVDGQGHADASRNTRIRRWDQSGTVRKADGTAYQDLNASASSDGIAVPPAGTQLVLENGILAEFGLDGVGQFKAGDRWVFAARSVDGSIEILDHAPPLGIHHHYAALALVKPADPSFGVIDQRTPFLPATGTVQVCAVLQVDANGRSRAVLPAQEIPVDRLADGLTVLTRQRLNPNTVNDGSLSVTAEIPYHLAAAYGGGPDGPIVAYQPVVLPAEVRPLRDTAISWQAFPQTTAFLTNILQHDVPRLGNVRFEREFDVYDNGGPASQWALAPGNVIIQTVAGAGTSGYQQTTVLPTMAVNRYKLNQNTNYVGLTVESSGYSMDGNVGLVYNWQSANDFSLFFARIVKIQMSTDPYLNLFMSHIQIKGGKVVDSATRDLQVSVIYSLLKRINFDIKVVGNQLQFGYSALKNDGYTLSSASLQFPPVPQLLPGSRLGVLTASTGTAKFTRLQVVYGNDTPATLVPAGLTAKLLSRLVLKRSLLQVLGPDGSSPGGVFAPPTPEPDFETWFWLVPPTPTYYGYGYGYGQGGAYQGIGAGRLAAAAAATKP